MGKGDEDYAPPPGPPPSHSRGGGGGYGYEEYAPPPGPPPSFTSSSHQHAWELAVPDTALLPPPPNYFGSYERSPANNATEQQADAGAAWCRRYPLSAPLAGLDRAALDALASGNLNVLAPQSSSSFGPNPLAIARVGPGVWKGHSNKGCPDSCLTTYPPLYSARTHNPAVTGRARTIYYEVNIAPAAAAGSKGSSSSSSQEVTLALGFAAPPYPPFRLPGWHRGSLGVHGDDGHRFVNNDLGGKDFTQPFRPGETVGIGMEFRPGWDDRQASYGSGRNSKGGGGGRRDIAVQIFFTREGREVGRWDLHEETDSQDGPVTGLEGYHDVGAAVGLFEQVGFELVFASERWKWRGYQGY
ncbi:hypothetical protein BX600DRAFT_429897 [Xylariales sp. PMI_506]|nr:hypothetical protein BX600DRAFT_429897 [Xylariales sp. PMI_506]